MTSRWDSSDDEEDRSTANKKQRTDVSPPPKTAAAEEGFIPLGSHHQKELARTEQNAATTNSCKVDLVVGNYNGSFAKKEETNPTSSALAPLAIKASMERRPQACRSVDEYERLNFIDQGTFGMVFRARCRQTGDIYDLKQVKLGAEMNKVGFPITALREANILLALRHPNIVRVREMVVGSSTDKVFMVMEYIENDLKTCMGMNKQPFSTAEVKQLMHQLMSAVEHMHKHWYVHRDLKTSNLLYSNTGRLAVCDFGLARKYGSPLAPYTFEVVTLRYRPPELLLGQRQYSTPLDIWSCACILAEMLTSKPLFPGEGEVDQMSKIFRLLGAPTEDKWPGVSTLPNFSKATWRAPSKSKLRDLFPVISYSGYSLNETGMDLLSGMLALDPSQRISASDCLRNPWLNGEEPLMTPLCLMPRFASASSSSSSSSSSVAAP